MHLSDVTKQFEKPLAVNWISFADTKETTRRDARIMALPVMEFQDQGYKIRKIFAKESTYPKEIIEF